MRVDASERRIDAKLHGVRAGEIQPDSLIVRRKYVSPGRSGLPHVVFTSVRQPKVDLSATRDFFNSVSPGDTVRGYYFADGYFIPENQAGGNRGGKWFLLGLAALMGTGALALARAMIRRP